MLVQSDSFPMIAETRRSEAKLATKDAMILMDRQPLLGMIVSSRCVSNDDLGGYRALF